MGDLPSSTLEDDKVIEELTAEIEQLQQQHAKLEEEKRQWQQKRHLLLEQYVLKLGLDDNQNATATTNKRSKLCGTKPITGQGETTLQDQMQTLLQSAHHYQQEALEDFRSILAQRKRLTETSNLARESKGLYDAFHIGYQGPFATINGLRLGAEAILEDYHRHQGDHDGGGTFLGGNRGGGLHETQNKGSTTTVKVPWSEINSALGQLALLLSCLEQKPHTGIRYKYEIVCCGSTSKIGVGARRDENARAGVTGAMSYYNLYSDDSFQFFGRRSFNTALQCLIHCVADAADAIQRRDPTIHLPHPIDRSNNREVTVGGLQVSYTADGVEWTRAMKYVLTNVKHLTAYRAFGLGDVVPEG